MRSLRPRKVRAPATSPPRRGRVAGDGASPSNPSTVNDLINRALNQVTYPVIVSDQVVTSPPVLDPPDPPVPPPVLDPPVTVSPVLDPLVPDPLVPGPPVPDPLVSDPPVVSGSASVVEPSSVPQGNSSIPHGGADPIVILVVNRPTWMDRVVNSPVGMELHLVHDISKDGEVLLDADDIKDKISYWANTLVGQFIGGRSSLSKVQDFVAKFWNHVGKPKVVYFKKGWFFFRFATAEDMALVLRGSTWSLGGHALVLKHWSPEFSKELDTVSKVPVWVTLPNLDPLFWSEKALSKIGSKIGVPLYADPVTTLKERLSFARVMIEVDVEFEWVPYYYKHCKKLGHEIENYRVLKRQTKGAVAVAVPTVAQPVVVPSIAAQATVVPSQVSAAVETLVVSSGRQSVAVTDGQPVVSSGLLSQTETEKDGFAVVTRKRGRRIMPVLNVDSANTVRLHFLEQEHEVIEFFRVNNLDVIGINETRVRSGGFSTISRRAFRNFHIIHNHVNHPNGRLWVIWKKCGLRIQALDTGSQWIHQNVSDGGSVHFLVTFVYAHNTALERVSLWDFLRGSSTSLPWLDLGDFNCVRYGTERLSVVPPNTRAMVEFNDALYGAGLDELKTHGCQFTWTNKQDDGDRKWMRLDRALVNFGWQTHFPGSYADALVAGVSDHSPIVVSAFSATSPKTRQIRFFNCWIGDEKFLPLVEDAWLHSVRGCPMYQLVSRLKLVKGKLKTLHRSGYSHISDRVAHARDQLQAFQERMRVDPMNPLILREEKELCLVFSKLRDAELSIMTDASTAYFFAKVAARRCSSTIAKVSDVSGVECSTPKDIYDAFPLDANIIQSGKCIISDAEIKSALFSIDVNKSPGPDGFTLGFFRAAWSVIQADFLRVVKTFFESGKMLKQVNFTLISLIPKGGNPSSVLDYRPISCCSIIYKTISKILTNPLKKAAFVYDRSINDNTMLAHELVKGYGRAGASPRYVIKIDIRKAFDSVSWEFLKSALPLYGFPSKFCDWIITCISSTYFSLKINGESAGFFPGKRGLRQGDPLSPLLFVLSMEVLSRIYHPKCCRVKLTHLIFADDLLVFTRDDYPSFVDYSRLVLNPAKTNVYFGGVRDDVKQLIMARTSYVDGSFPFKYLGVPLHPSRLTVHIKIKHWANTFLSYAGKDIDKMCRQFIWGYSEGQRRMVFFRWSNVCRPGAEGGFDIREILSWNKAMLVRMFWKLHSTMSVVLKGLVRARDELVCRLGNHSSAVSMLRSCCRGGKLRLGVLYDIFRNPSPHLRWAKATLDALIAQRHQIITQMAIQAGLPTIDNLIKRGLHLVNRCVLCKCDCENAQHLFFGCVFSKEVMQQVFLWQHITRRPRGIRYELNRSLVCGRSVWRRKWARCVITSGVYFLWQERNFRIFRGVERSIGQLVLLIKYHVSLRLCANVHGDIADEIMAHL
ncbi:hypothetical protein RND81_12G056000 [Saponaria officinalis]|uniref:Reverse transcriptase domain-containing protein n=1 Tax=Saponaria officinalis TaxID=3572 RepID=A0AAW1H5J7_SAPOF